MLKEKRGFSFKFKSKRIQFGSAETDYTIQVLVLYDEFFQQNENGEISKEKFLEERQVFLRISKYEHHSILWEGRFSGGVAL